MSFFERWEICGIKWEKGEELTIAIMERRPFLLDTLDIQLVFKSRTKKVVRNQPIIHLT